MITVTENGKTTTYTAEEWYGVAEMQESTKATLIETLKEATRQTCGNNPHNVIAACVLVTETQRTLHNEYGMTWTELEQIQIDTLQSM